MGNDREGVGEAMEDVTVISCESGESVMKIGPPERQRAAA
jgi:hypothetical protein